MCSFSAASAYLVSAGLGEVGSANGAVEAAREEKGTLDLGYEGIDSARRDDDELRTFRRL